MVPVPERVCDICGEFLPHACAPIVILKRQRFTGRRLIRIIDRELS